MLRTIEFLNIPEHRQTAVLHLAHATNDPRDKDMERLVLVTGGVAFVQTAEGCIFIGSGCTSNAVRVAAGVPADFVSAATAYPTLHTIVGTRQIDGALAHTEVTSFNDGGTKRRASADV